MSLINPERLTCRKGNTVDANGKRFVKHLTPKKRWWLAPSGQSEGECSVPCGLQLKESLRFDCTQSRK